MKALLVAVGTLKITLLNNMFGLGSVSLLHVSTRILDTPKVSKDFRLRYSFFSKNNSINKGRKT